MKLGEQIESIRNAVKAIEHSVRHIDNTWSTNVNQELRLIELRVTEIEQLVLRDEEGK